MSIEVAAMEHPEQGLRVGLLIRNLQEPNKSLTIPLTASEALALSQALRSFSEQITNHIN